VLAAAVSLVRGRKEDQSLYVCGVEAEGIIGYVSKLVIHCALHLICLHKRWSTW
jgi:hypothetical protein